MYRHCGKLASTVYGVFWKNNGIFGCPSEWRICTNEKTFTVLSREPCTFGTIICCCIASFNKFSNSTSDIYMCKSTYLILLIMQAMCRSSASSVSYFMLRTLLDGEKQMLEKVWHGTVTLYILASPVQITFTAWNAVVEWSSRIMQWWNRRCPRCRYSTRGNDMQGFSGGVHNTLAWWHQFRVIFCSCFAWWLVSVVIRLS